MGKKTLFAAILVAGTTVLAGLAAELDCGLVDLAAMIRGHPEYFMDLVHVKRECLFYKVFPIAVALWRAGVVRVR